jgi:hypothetical protein
MLSVAIKPGPSLGVGTPQVRFDGDYLPEDPAQGAQNYDVSGDGRRFLMLSLTAQAERTDSRPEMVVVQHWFEELKRLVPAN